jgi:hypothetical protein
MIDTALLILIATTAAILIASLYLQGNARTTSTRARTGVRLHQIRRNRELTELRFSIQSDARQLRRALDQDFDALDES